MIFNIANLGHITEPTEFTLRLRCPSCHKQGTFDVTVAKDLLASKNAQPGVTWIFGQRRCPDSYCGAHIFFVADSKSRKLLISYPAQRIDFDASDIPREITVTLEEAITCHANHCYVAAAIMVRKTLEHLCDKQGATAKNLKERIKALGAKVVLPKELLDGLDDLRLLGNDAAHIESNVFNRIGKEEVEIGIEFTKEVLKATYQYATLLSRLRGLKKL